MPGLRLRHRGLTLIELMVVVALIVVVIALAAPSFKQTVERQRVSSTNAQLVTDMQFARSEAATRNQHVRVTFASNSSMSCYVIYTYNMSVAGSLSRCNCLVDPACTAAGSTEIRVVRIPRDTSVAVLPQSGMPIEFAFEPLTGALYKIPTDFFSPPLAQYAAQTQIDSQRTLRTTMGRSGRPTVCAPVGSKMQAPAC